MEIKSFIGKKFDNVNEVWKDLRRQIEFDRYLKHQTNVKLTYEYYYPPKNPIDFLSKRYILYPLYMRKHTKNLTNNIVYQIHFQFLGDLANYLDREKTIITCHDIYNFLEKNSLRNSIFAQKYALLGLKKCKYIIAISEFTKNELINKLNIPKERIFVIKNAINNEMFKPIPQNKSSEIEPLFPNYRKILYVGNESDRKNFITLIKAFYLLKKKIKNLKLIRVGSTSNFQLIKKLGLQKDIIYLKYVSNKRLREIYNLCDIFVTASLYEGFGFPGLEAAACGTPVICTDIPIFREIYQNFPIYFPPKDYKKLVRIIIENINDEEKKKDLGQKGINLAKSYSWQKSAEEYHKYVKKIIENN